MTNWLPIIERMEEALARTLARAEPPCVDAVEPSRNASLPSLDELLSPTAGRLAEAEKQVQMADAQLAEAAHTLAAWRERLAALGVRLEGRGGRAVS